MCVHGGISLQSLNCTAKEVIMRDRFSGLTVTVAIAAGGVSAVISLPATRTSAQVIPSPVQTGEGKAGGALKTPWGGPDLQGNWTDAFCTAPPRPPREWEQGFFSA